MGGNDEQHDGGERQSPTWFQDALKVETDDVVKLCHSLGWKCIHLIHQDGILYASTFVDLIRDDEVGYSAPWSKSLDRVRCPLVHEANAGFFFTSRIILRVALVKLGVSSYYQLTPQTQICTQGGFWSTLRER